MKTVLSDDLIMQLKQDAASSAVARGRRAKLLRNMTTLSREEISHKYPYLKANTLKSWEIGREGGLSEKGARKLIEMALAEGIFCAYEWLMYEIGEWPRIIYYKKTGGLSQALETYPINSNTSSWNHHITDELRLFKIHQPNAIYVQIEDDAMEPFYLIHDIVAGNAQSETELQSLIGKNCIVQLTDGKYLARNLRQGKSAHHYNLFCLNSNTTQEELVHNNVELLCAAEIIWHRKLK